MNHIELARKTIEEYFKNKKFEPDIKTQIKFKEKKASFVTLTKNKDLRGCVGSLKKTEPLWENIMKNAIYAAFYDSRFPPLRETELNQIQIEVSILSEPKEINFKTEKELLCKITQDMGLILENGKHSATFLPQVWDEIEDKKDFLEALSLKAGLKKNEWKNSKIFYYNIESFKE